MEEKRRNNPSILSCNFLPNIIDTRFRTRTRTNTNPNGTEANAAGRSVLYPCCGMLWCKGNQSDEFPRRLARVLVCFEHMRSKMARKNHESFATLVIQGFFQSRSQRIYQRDGENIGGSLCQATGQRRLGLSRMLSSNARTSHILSKRESFRLARHCL